MSNRDNFPERVRRAVAARAGWQCSICQKLTVGPSEEAPNAVTKIGKAAHIAAAASGPGARRYDAAMTPDQRAGIGNAIWLCSDHADLIDRDEVTYTVASLQLTKSNHEQTIARMVRSGRRVELATDLLAIGPDVVCTGDLAVITTDGWKLRLEHFLIGDIHRLVAFIQNFRMTELENRYVLSNELGDGRTLLAGPTLTKDVDGYILFCPVANSFPRLSAHSLAADLALDENTFDLCLDEKGDIALVSGLDSLSQKLQSILSTQQGESDFNPTFGARFFDYFWGFLESPWLDLLLKLDIVRLAAIPFQDRFMHQKYTPLQCVTRVQNFQLLAEKPVSDRLPARITLDVQGVGEWVRDLWIYMPTAEQLAEQAATRKKLITSNLASLA